MKLVILCGGQGTRIRDVAENIPKPMIPVGNNPIVWHIMKYYSTFDIKDFVLCLGYKKNVIKDFFLNYKPHVQDFTIHLGSDSGMTFYGSLDEDNWNVTLADTGLNAMTGARIRKIKKYIGDDENFMITYGDGLGDVDLNALMDFHKSHGKVLTLTGVRPPGRFGELGVSEDGTITAFNEKPQASGGRINGGFFIANRKLFDYLDDGDDLVFEQDPMRKLVADNQLMMFDHDGFWQPMDTHREYVLLNDLVDKNEAPWVKW